MDGVHQEEPDYPIPRDAALRAHLQIHRGMPKWVLALLQLFWNHHTFERGQRAGSSPLELAGVADAPSLSEVLDRLFPREVAAQTI